MSRNQSAARTQHTRKARLIALLSWPAVRRLALAAPVAGLALAAAVIPAGIASANVNPNPTTTTVSSSANPSGFKMLVTYTATIDFWAGGTGYPVDKGTVSFTDNGRPITGCTAIPVDEYLTWPTCQAYLSLGTHTVAATYNQTVPWYLGSTGSMTQKVIW